jgi:hypothetical protein
MEYQLTDCNHIFVRNGARFGARPRPRSQEVNAPIGALVKSHRRPLKRVLSSMTIECMVGDPKGEQTRIPVDG